MKTSFMWVTPEMAAQWLEKNTRNRALRPGGAAVYAAEIKAGRWLVHHQGIAFDTTGALVDGQHRLQAIVDTGIPVPLNVTFGLPVGSMDAVDRGMVRNVPDILRLHHGIDNSRRIAALVAVLGQVAEAYHLKMTPGVALAIYRKWKPEIDWAVPLPNKGPLWKAPIVAAFVIARRREPEATARFVAAFRDLDAVPAEQPVHYLHRTILSPGRPLDVKGPALTAWVLAAVRKQLHGETIVGKGTIRRDDTSGLEYFLQPAPEGGAAA